jgi:hypothetical protein
MLVLAGLAGCSSIEPWVKPYERDKLVYEAREGARGGEGAAGGGCGCN